jgi:hypothetical protein
VKCRSEGIAFHTLGHHLHASYDSIELILFKFRTRLAEIRALTTTDCRAALISIGADPVICVEFLGGEASILLFGENPGPSVGEVKKQHV